jgi:hypothetical protein
MISTSFTGLMASSWHRPTITTWLPTESLFLGAGFRANDIRLASMTSTVIAET